LISYSSKTTHIYGEIQKRREVGTRGLVNNRYLHYERGRALMVNQSLSLNVIKSIRSVSAGTKGGLYVTEQRM